MLSSHPEHDAVRDVSDLETALSGVESHLMALGHALQAHDAAATEGAATDLHRALTVAVRRFSDAAGRGGVPPVLRRRLAVATGLVAAQRDAVSRATSVLDRAIDLLLPPSPSAVPIYGASGSTFRSHRGGSAQA
jgi:hypothetical protein